MVSAAGTRAAGRRASALPDERSRRVAGQRQRVRPLHLHAHQVRRPPAVAALPEMRQGLPEDRSMAGAGSAAANATAWCTPQPGNRPTSAISIARTESGSGWATHRGAPLRVTTSRQNRSACVGKPIDASRRNTRTCRTGGQPALWSGSASSSDHRGATFAGRRSRPGVAFCCSTWSTRNLTRSRVTRWHVRAHSCLVMWVSRSQSFRHDASHSAPRARTSSSADFGTLATAAFAGGTVEEVVLSVGAATEVVLSGCAADWA